MKRWIAATLICAAVLCVFSLWSIRTTSVTLDETYYLACGLQTIHDRQLDPRLARHGVAPLPILFEYLPPLSMAHAQERPSPWIGQIEDPKLIPGPRYFTILLAGVPLVALVSWWLYRRHGLAAAFTGAALAALSPSILAHSAVATTDLTFALFTLLALAAIAAFFKQPSRKHFFLMALAIAAAMSAKYAGLFLLPVVFILLCLRASPDTVSKRLSRALFRFALLLLLTLPMWWGFHSFSLIGTSDIPGKSIALPAPFVGAAFQYLHNREGHIAFLCGKLSQTGWWYYYAYAFFFKSTPAELALAALLIVFLAAALRSPVRSFQNLDAGQQVLVSAALVFTALLLSSNINIGHRYLLPLYPVLIILGIDCLWNRLGNSNRSTSAAVILLVGVQLWSCLSVAPHCLSYFNTLVGGPSQGWRLLADSSTDWGQDLPALRQELEKHPGARTALSYFGTTLPEAYGIQADPIERLTLPVGEYNLLAVSATHLQGLYGTGDQPFRKFLSLAPVSRAGYSILLYDLSDPAARSAFQSAVELTNRESKSTSSTLSLYAFTMTLMASQDFEDLDIFDLCYARMFRDPALAPAQLAFVEGRLENAAEPIDYKTRFRLAILCLARWTLLPRAAFQEHGEHWTQTFDFDLFRKDYSDSLQWLKGSGDIGMPLVEALNRTAGRIDSNHDGKFSDPEITAFLRKKQAL
jgi:hypothetical protein